MEPLPVPEVGALTEMELSRAAEFLVAADLTLRGHPASIAPAGLAYDVVVDVGGRLLRVQVKATRGPRRIPQRVAYTPGYLFHLRRCGAGGRKAYCPEAFDCYALVALDTRHIAYLAVGGVPVRQTIHLRPVGFVGAKWTRNTKSIGDYPWEDCLRAL